MTAVCHRCGEPIERDDWDIAQCSVCFECFCSEECRDDHAADRHPPAHTVDKRREEIARWGFAGWLNTVVP